MSLTLISANEVRDMLGTLEVVQVEGVPYVNARELATAVNKLCGGADAGRVSAPSLVPATAEDLAAVLETRAAAVPEMESMVHDAINDTQNLLEKERDRLALLPPGPCAACRCETKIAHPDGRCVECDCLPYIDSTERDPVITLAERGIASTPDAAIAPAVSMFDVGAIGLDTSREPMSKRFVD